MLLRSCGRYIPHSSYQGDVSNPELSLLEPFPHKQSTAYHGSVAQKVTQMKKNNLREQPAEQGGYEELESGSAITIGIRCGVKLTVTFEFAASDNPCSISGTVNKSELSLVKLHMIRIS